MFARVVPTVLFWQLREDEVCTVCHRLSRALQERSVIFDTDNSSYGFSAMCHLFS